MDMWLKILAALRAKGLAQNVTDLASVKAFAAEKNITLAGADGKALDIDAAYEAHAKSATTLTITDAPPPEKKSGDDTEIVGLEDKIEAAVQKRLDRMGISKDEPGTEKKVNLTEDHLETKDVKVASLEASWKSTAPAGEKRLFETHERAFGFGNYFVGHVLALDPRVPDTIKAKCREDYAKWLSRQKAGAYMTFPTAAGGALTGTQFSSDIFQQMKEYGVAMRECEVVEMSEGEWSGLTASGELDVYFPDEGGTVNPTRQNLANIRLRAKKAMAMTFMTREIRQDSIANLGDHVAREFARAFAKKVDACVFLGDGTSTYGKMLGITHIFGSAATTNARSVTGGDTTVSHTLPNLIELIAKLPVFARGNAKFYGDPSILALTFTRLGLAQMGSNAAEFDGRATYGVTGLGRPLVPVNVMNSNANTGGDVVDILFGDLRQTVIIGRRQDLIIESSLDHKFDEDKIALKGTMRFDTNVRGLGSAAAAGSMVALYQT